MKRLDGRKLADRIHARIKERVSTLNETPGLAIILVGDDPASHLYVGLKETACHNAGIHFEKHLYPANTPTQTIIDAVNTLNERADIHGILVQLPLPEQDTQAVIDAIHPNKDVDGFHKVNQDKLENDEPCLAPAAALGIMKLIESTEVDLQGKTAAVIGSELFTRPLKFLLRERGVTTERIAKNDPDMAEKTPNYDILIPVAGKPGMIQPNMIADETIVIDVGTTRVGEETLGDVNAEAFTKNTGWLTPVPGGVGPMTVAMLLVNVLKAYQLQK